MGRLAGSFLAILIFAFANVARAEAPFVFVDVTDCKSPEFKNSEDAQSRFAGMFCADGPKAWTEGEKRQVSAAFDELLSLELGSALVARVVAERGPIRLLRASKFVFNANAHAVAEVHIGSIKFYDKRFDPKLSRYEWPLKWTTAHEIGHIFDCLPSNVGTTYDCLSGQKTFAKVMGLRERKIKLQDGSSVIGKYPKGYVESEYQAVRASAKELLRSGHEAEAFAKVRAYAASLHVPSMYSLTGGGEMFADLIAAVIFDPAITSTLPASAPAFAREKILVRP